MDVTVEQYREAKKLVGINQKVISQYLNQQAKKSMYGTYIFLYYYDDSDEGGEWRNYKAKNIESACKKMAKYLSGRKRKLQYVDYEVEFNNAYIDISEIECINEFVN